jgi:hypothetical protein
MHEQKVQNIKNTCIQMKSKKQKKIENTNKLNGKHMTIVSTHFAHLF